MNVELNELFSSEVNVLVRNKDVALCEWEIFDVYWCMWKGLKELSWFSMSPNYPCFLLLVIENLQLIMFELG